MSKRACIWLTVLLLVCITIALGPKAFRRIREVLLKRNVLITSLVQQRFESTIYQILWYRDLKSDIALGINLGDFKDSSFGTRIHDGDTFPKEFSCMPDDMLYAEYDGKVESAYVPYLRWEVQAAVNEGGRQVSISYHYAPKDGLLTKYIEPEILKTMDLVQAEANVVHEHTVGTKFVTTTIHLKNVYTHPARLWWVYQDGPVLFLPEQSQANVVPISSKSFEQFEILKKENSRPWIGVAHRSKGVGSVIASSDASFYFTLPGYLGVLGAACGLNGMTCPLGGNDRFTIDQKKSPPDLLADWGGKLGQATSSDLKIQGIVMDFGILGSGEEAVRSFIRAPVVSKGDLSSIIRDSAQIANSLPIH